MIFLVYVLFENQYNIRIFTKQICSVDVPLAKTSVVFFLCAHIEHEQETLISFWILTSIMSKDFKWMALLCIFNMFHQLYDMFYHLQHLVILVWHAFGFHSRYQWRWVTLVAKAPSQQLWIHQMSTFWMQVCYNQMLHDVK